MEDDGTSDARCEIGGDDAGGVDDGSIGSSTNAAQETAPLPVVCPRQPRERLRERQQRCQQQRQGEGAAGDDNNPTASTTLEARLLGRAEAAAEAAAVAAIVSPVLDAAVDEIEAGTMDAEEVRAALLPKYPWLTWELLWKRMRERREEKDKRRRKEEEEEEEEEQRRDEQRKKKESEERAASVTFDACDSDCDADTAVEPAAAAAATPVTDRPVPTAAAATPAAGLHTPVGAPCRTAIEEEMATSASVPVAQRRYPTTIPANALVIWRKQQQNACSASPMNPNPTIAEEDLETMDGLDLDVGLAEYAEQDLEVMDDSDLEVGEEADLEEANEDLTTACRPNASVGIPPVQQQQQSRAPKPLGEHLEAIARLRAYHADLDAAADEIEAGTTDAEEVHAVLLSEYPWITLEFLQKRMREWRTMKEREERVASVTVDDCDSHCDANTAVETAAAAAASPRQWNRRLCPPAGAPCRTAIEEEMATSTSAPVAQRRYYPTTIPTNALAIWRKQQQNARSAPPMNPAFAEDLETMDGSDLDVGEGVGLAAYAEQELEVQVMDDSGLDVGEGAGLEKTNEGLTTTCRNPRPSASVRIPPVQQQQSRAPEPLGKHVEAMARLRALRASRVEQQQQPRAPKPLGKYFEARLRDLEAYRAEHGHLAIRSSDKNYRSIGGWAGRVRMDYRRIRRGAEGGKYRLTQEQIASLEAIGFQWEVEPKKPNLSKYKERHAKIFEEKLRELEAFKAQHGHCDVPQPHPGLGSFVHLMRQDYRKFKEGSAKHKGFTQEKVDALEAIGFKWSLRKQNGRKTFKERLEEVRGLVEDENGGCDSWKKPYLHFEDVEDEGLRTWLSGQRTQYKFMMEGKPSSMTEEKVASLAQLGFAWNDDIGRFENKIEELRQYKRKFGHLCISLKNCEPEYRHLALFLIKTRSNYRLKTKGQSSDLSDNQIQDLEDLGLSLENNSQAFYDKKVAELRRFKAEHSHLDLDENHPTLGKTVCSLRSNYRLVQKGGGSNLTLGHIEELRTLGFSFVAATSPQIFQDKVLELQAYKVAKGNCEVPFNHPRLGKWVIQLGREYAHAQAGRLHSLKKSQIAALSSMGFQWKLHRRPQSFEESFQELKEWEARQQHDPTKKEYDPYLSKFATKVRKKYKLWKAGKPGGLTAEQVEELSSVGFEFVKKKFFEDRLKELREYKALHGNVAKPDGDLGKWVSSIRSAYPRWRTGGGCRSRVRLTEERVEQLASLGFEFALSQQSTDD